MANMYARLAEGVEMRGKQVLEIGSGFGGGAALLSRCRCPALYLGVDYDPAHVKAAQQRLATTGPCELKFAQGNAMNLRKLQDASFDVVLSIESSHGFPQLEPFLREVKRLLRPGGTFVFADFRKGHEDFLDLEAALRRAFPDHAYVNTNLADVTPHVIRSLQLRATELKGRAKRCEAFVDPEACADHVGVHEFFGSGQNDASYLFFRTEKRHDVLRDEL